MLLDQAGKQIRGNKNVNGIALINRTIFRLFTPFAQQYCTQLMKVNEINAYLQRAREIIGDRSRMEIDYDNSVVARLSAGMDIKSAIRAVNQEYPEEALKPSADQWSDLAARYNYIREHKAILKRLGMNE